MPESIVSRAPLARPLHAACLSLWLAAFAAAPVWAAPPAVIALSPDQQTALGVRLAPVQPAAAAQIDLPARVTVPPTQQAVVAAPAAAMVVRLLVNPGETVKPGQPLAELSSAQIAQLQRERSEAQSRLDLAQQQLQRDTLLVEEGIVPTARLEAARAQSRQAQALLAERDLALKLAAGGTALNGLAVLRAPIGGVITEANALPGQRVDMAAPLFRIAQQGSLWLEIDASPQQAAQLQAGAAVSVTEFQAHGVVQAKSTALNAGQSVLLRARLTQPGSLQPGAVVQARVSLPAQSGLWRVPPSALTQFGGKDAVLVRDKAGFRVVAVDVASRLNDAVTVRGALRGGDQVAASGVVAIKAAAGEVTP
ncbi:efflux RND transporter periplasmic adaptor subunit [Thiomonas sp.]|jgi:RND family efflux transporter MFP subunit|uniref:efflux RND transporter periplasmic adaptor subunit n=1 Tax=Thiomonas sp. TaxID=2047785 RepID=UPI00262D2300|nr:efflux RND transporter periplasmic adaptor subunit [Thiomonas sp.]